MKRVCEWNSCHPRKPSSRDELFPALSAAQHRWSSMPPSCSAAALPLPGQNPPPLKVPIDRLPHLDGKHHVLCLPQPLPLRRPSLECNSLHFFEPCRRLFEPRSSDPLFCFPRGKKMLPSHHGEVAVLDPIRILRDVATGPEGPLWISG